MKSTFCVALLVAAGCVVPCAGITFAQQETTQAATKKERPTLVVRDSAGSLVRVDVAVEYAAVAKLTLTEEEQKNIDAVFASREKLIDGALRHATANIPRVARVVEEKNSTEVRAKVRELDASAPMLRDREDFRKSLTLAMTSENAGFFATMLREYMLEAGKQAQREAQADNKKGMLALMTISESLRVAAMDVRASLHRVGGAAWPTLREVLPSTGISAASSSVMTGQLDAYAAAYPDGGTAKDRGEAFFNALQKLADDQQRVLVDALYKQFAPDVPPMKKVEAPLPEAEPAKKPAGNEPVLQPK